MNLWDTCIFCLTTGLTAAVLIKLWFSGLAKIYRLLSLYLAWDFLTSLVGLRLPYNTTAYGYFYIFSQTIKIAIAAFMCAEIYGLALERTPALAAFLSGIVGYVLAVAALIPLILALTDHSSFKHPVLRAYLLFEQTMDATMALFLILMSLLIAWFPVRMRRNVISYICGFVVWWLCRSAALHLVSRFSSNRRAVGIINGADMGVVLACLLLWLLGLRREGEVKTAVVGHRWNRAAADRLAGRLEAVNDGLERLRRRQPSN